MDQPTLDQVKKRNSHSFAPRHGSRDTSSQSSFFTVPELAVFRSMCDAMNKNWETISVFVSHTIAEELFRKKYTWWFHLLCQYNKLYIAPGLDCCWKNENKGIHPYHSLYILSSQKMASHDIAHSQPPK